MTHGIAQSEREALFVRQYRTAQRETSAAVPVAGIQRAATARGAGSGREARSALRIDAISMSS